MIFDTHAHYDDARFDEDREALLLSMKEHGIGHIINVGAEMKGCRNTVSLVKKYPFLYGAVGVHPDGAPDFDETCIEELREMAKQERIIAIGEIGLDYYYDEPEREVQKIWFGKQLELAKELALPVVIHSRDAAKDTIDLMKEHHVEEIGGVIHCYSYSKESAAIFLNMGFYIGIGGVLTFKNGVKLKEVASYVPMDRIVLETD